MAINNNILYYLAIIAIVYFLMKKYNLKEKFKGMINYVDQHNYLNCCRKYGCRHFRCRRFINNKLSKNRPQKIGYLKYNGGGKDNILYLFKQKDYRNTNKYKYFYQKNYGKNSMLKELKTRSDLFSNDPITLDKKKYIVNIFDNNFVNHYNTKRRFYKKRITVPKVIFKNYNYVGELENLNVPENFYIYGKIVDYHRNLYTYVVLQRKGKKLYVISRLNYHNKLNIGDNINIKVGPSLFTPFTVV